jgi:hypothetical protein
MDSELHRWDQSGSRWFWRDSNGDGQVQAGEFTIYDISYRYTWGIDIDSKGDVRFGNRSLVQFPFGGIDENGVPKYSTEAIIKTPAPENDIVRLRHFPENDRMYLAFSGSIYPRIGKIVRYDNWSGEKTPKWTITPQYRFSSDWTQEVVAESFDVAGDHVFVIYGAKTPRADQQPGTEDHGEIEMYNAETGAYVQSLFPGKEAAYESGCIDFPYAMRAFFRSNGEYVVTAEEDWKAKIITYNVGTPAKETFVSTPVLSPRGGVFDDPVTVTMECPTPQAIIRFTTDGTEPNEQSPSYAAPLPITRTGLVRMRAFRDGLKPSLIDGADFYIKNEGAAVRISLGHTPSLAVNAARQLMLSGGRGGLTIIAGVSSPLSMTLISTNGTVLHSGSSPAGRIAHIKTRDFASVPCILKIRNANSTLCRKIILGK